MARFLSRILNCKKNKEIKITKVFHSCFVIEYSDGVRVLIDPYFGTAVPERFTLTEKPPYSKEKIPKINLILLTHEHFDHFEKDTINYLVKRDNCIVAGPRNVMNELTDLPKNNMRVVSIDDKLICSMINIRVLPCQHPQSFYPLAFLLEYENTKIYYAGDTENLPNVSFDADIAIMPAGGTFMQIYLFW
jgi:L-ascorbate metabolism protein UlaG (beta-lactamase superfamily)